jgi:sigma-B regulation protein RsbU (phosphoserine phosphatase)
MPATPMPRVLLAGNPTVEDVRFWLEGAGYEVATVRLTGTDPTEVTRSQVAIVAVDGDGAESARGVCRRWRIELGDQYVPIVWIADGLTPEALAAALEAGADICLPQSVRPETFLAQLKALLRVQHLNARLLARAGEVQQLNQRLQQAYQQIDGDLDLTRRIHRDFLPRTLPEVLQARFAVCYRPRSRVGGDFYDVMRLDEEHVAVYVADAMGHGLPASSLLGVFVKKSIQAKQITGRAYWLVPPDEVLGRLNRDLVALSLPEPPFVTMVWLMLNCRDGELTFARAAHPQPLYVPAEGDPCYWHAPGTLLGVFEANFPAQQHQLHSGDKVLLYSDGAHPPGAGTQVGANDALTESVRRHRHLAIQPFVDHVARDLLELARGQEDFTLLGIEYR